MKTNAPPSLLGQPFFQALLAPELEAAKFPTDEQLADYARAFPELAPRAAAAKAVREHTKVAREVVDRILDVYPLKESFALYHEKCVRDIVTVLRYTALGMLLNDEEWMRQKFLIWYKTIVQSFRFPDRRPAKRRVLTDPAMVEECERLKPWQRCVFETYAFTDVKLREAIPADVYREFAPFMKLTVHTLSHD